jgi:hypothetical protein
VNSKSLMYSNCFFYFNNLDIQSSIGNSTTDDTTADSLCSSLICDHPKARNWVLCSVCELWYHCICASITSTKAKNDSFVFVFENVNSVLNNEINTVCNSIVYCTCTTRTCTCTLSTEHAQEKGGAACSVLYSDCCFY